MKSVCTLFVFILIVSTAFSHPFKGSGTKDDPYQITNVNELQALNSCYTDDSTYCMLMNDIDATETKFWNVGDHDGDSTTPDEPQGFMPIYNHYGTFDGNGHVIYNLYINRPKMSSVGLFISAQVYSVIKRVGLENCYFVGWSVTSFCTNFNSALIEQCYSTGTLIATSNYGAASGFCWNNNWGGKIINCYTTCNITDQSTDSNDYSAIGFCNNMGSIEYCYAAGKINSSKNASIYGYGEYALSSFWDEEITGVPHVDSLHYAKGLQTSEMKKRSTFEKAGWDFDSTWCIDEGNTYPRLKIFNRCKDYLAGAESSPSNSLFNLEVVPNPSGKITEIKYSLSQPCNVSLRVVNSLGKEELSLVSDEFTQSGQHSVTFDASVLSSGLYFCTIKAGGFTQTKQIVIIK